MHRDLMSSPIKSIMKTPKSQVSIFLKISLEEDVQEIRNFLEFFELDNCQRCSEGICSAYSLIKTARLFHIYFCNLLNNNIF